MSNAPCNLCGGILPGCCQRAREANVQPLWPRVAALQNELHALREEARALNVTDLDAKFDFAEAVVGDVYAALVEVEEGE